MTEIPGELRKVIARALFLLAKARICAVLSDAPLSSAERGKGDFILVDILAGGGRKKVGSLCRSALDVMVQKGWVKGAENEFKISEAGLSYMRRCASRSDAFQAQHQDRKFVNLHKEGRTQTVMVNDAESPLAWLAKRRGKNGRALLNDTQFDAGERLRQDFWFAQMAPRVTANWSVSAPQGSRRRGAASGSDMSDHVIAAKARVDAALRSVGPELGGVLIDVCCHMNGLEVTEKSNGWPQRSGKIVLVLALSSLARHYGMSGGDGISGSGQNI